MPSLEKEMVRDGLKCKSEGLAEGTWGFPIEALQFLGIISGVEDGLFEHEARESSFSEIESYKELCDIKKIRARCQPRWKEGDLGFLEAKPRMGGFAGEDPLQRGPGLLWRSLR